MLDTLVRSLWIGAIWGLWAMLATPRRPGSSNWQHAWSAIKSGAIAAALGLTISVLYNLMVPASIRATDDESECARHPAIYGC
jgi:hypothetical protein